MTFRYLCLVALLALSAWSLAQPVVFERQGVGDDFFVLDLSEPAIVRLTHDGDSNFVVLAYPKHGRRELLVNEIGDYRGTRPLGLMELPVVDVEVQADGPWTFTVLPLSAAPKPGTFTDGVGDTILNFAEVEGRALSLTHDGLSNFVVLGHGEQRSVMVNEIGAYSGRIRLVPGTLIVEIQADGRWTLDVE